MCVSHKWYIYIYIYIVVFCSACISVYVFARYNAKTLQNHYTMNTIPWTQYHEHNTMITIQWSQYNDHYTMNTIQWSRYNDHNTMITIQWSRYHDHDTMIMIQWSWYNAKTSQNNHGRHFQVCITNARNEVYIHIYTRINIRGVPCNGWY